MRPWFCILMEWHLYDDSMMWHVRSEIKLSKIFFSSSKNWALAASSHPFVVKRTDIWYAWSASLYAFKKIVCV